MSSRDDERHTDCNPLHTCQIPNTIEEKTMLRIKAWPFFCHLTFLLRKTDLLLYFAQCFGGVIIRLLRILLDDLVDIILVA